MPRCLEGSGDYCPKLNGISLKNNSGKRLASKMKMLFFTFAIKSKKIATKAPNRIKIDVVGEYNG
jgi:hypothetical protein